MPSRATRSRVPSEACASSAPPVHKRPIGAKSMKRPSSPSVGWASVWTQWIYSPLAVCIRSVLGAASLVRAFFVGRFELVLRSFHELPPHMQFNQFIKHYYRVYYRKRDCLRSIFCIHNETLNIHTHLFGLLLFAYLMYSTAIWLADMHLPSADDLSSSVGDAAASLKDWKVFLFHVIVLCGYLAAVCHCLLSSTLYHVFGCHSSCTFERLLSLDYSGITVLICASQVPVVCYLFYHEDLLRYAYLAGLFGVSFASHTITHSPRFQGDEHNGLRITMFSANAMFGVLPLLHFAVIEGLSIYLWNAICYVALMYVTYGLGILIYASQTPERWWPGLFDLVLHSHQLWHVLVVAAALWQFYAVLSLYLLRAHTEDTHHQLHGAAVLGPFVSLPLHPQPVSL